MTGLKRVWLLLMGLILGCSSHTVERTRLLQMESRQIVKEYRIQPGDLLDIKFFYNPELNEQLVVRPDGKITLQLVNDVVAAGLTPADLTASLTKAFASDLRNPKVAVILKTSVADRVYVDGEVNRAGLVPLVGQTTVLQLISQAGGLKETAKSGEVILIRFTDENQRSVYKLSLNDTLNKAGSSQDVYLKPNDIVIVPKSTISNINTWVDLYLRRNIPIPLGLSIGSL